MKKLWFAAAAVLAVGAVALSGPLAAFRDRGSDSAAAPESAAPLMALPGHAARPVHQPEPSAPSPSAPESPEIPDFAALPHYREALAGRYIDYWEDYPGMDIRDVVTYVNIGLDLPFYGDVARVEDPDDILVLCNKRFALPEDYAPKDLARTGGFYLRREARDAFNRMKKDAKKEGCDLNISSSYRSFESQRSFYDRYVRNERADGYSEDEAISRTDRYSARPGHSEHQTGLAVDLRVRGSTGPLSSMNYEETDEYAWLEAHAHLYGFILRYPSGCEHITGYVYEPWHWRYVGEETATHMYENKIATFEEYVALIPVT